MVERCLELGVNFFDTANAYSSSEERIGRAIAGRKREDLIIGTKTAHRERDKIGEHLELSLKRLGTDSEEIVEIAGVITGSREMTEEETREMQRLRDELGTLFCRRCNYCQPCTEGIPISTVMIIGSFAKRFPPERLFTGNLAEAMDKATDCSEYGDCEERCPYKLPIREMISEQVEWYQVEKGKFQALTG